MDKQKNRLTEEKYRLPYHWIRSPLHRDSILYYGYLRAVLDLIPRDPCRILDAGCGDGFFASMLQEKGHEVAGVDYLEVSVQYARMLVPGGEFHQADLRTGLPRYGDGPARFDGAVLIEVYEHIPPEDCPKVLRTIREVVKPGGFFIMTVPTRAIPMSRLHYRHFDEDGLRDELESAGWSIRSIVRQHSIGPMARLLFHPVMERILENGVLEPVILKRARRYTFLRWLNLVRNSAPCGRYIAVARRPEV